MTSLKYVLGLAALALCLGQAPACAAPPAQVHVAWSRDASIYEVNIRQYTPQGSIKAFATHLPRLKEMGVDILWIMPVQPIGELNRKGKLGSYYAVRDYTAVNPEFGTMDDFRAMVDQAHKLGMHVILDWVANHTAFDHAWTKTHKDWYKQDAKGELFPVTFKAGTPDVEYWTDVTALNYGNAALWSGMTEAMAFWVREAGVDGFRCDVAGLVPTAFWNQARAELDKIKPVFMLAEWSEPELHEQAFDMTYGWDLATILQRIGKGKADARDLAAYVARPKVVFPRHAYRMQFTSNHDINSWHGSDKELYGALHQPLAVLAATLPGMPLIYGGQEAGLDKRLSFFEKDLIAWKDHPMSRMYRFLLKTKKDNPALANGQYGAPAEVLATGNNKVFAFRRKQDGNEVTVVVNLSRKTQRYTLPGARPAMLKPALWRITTSP